MQIIPGIDNHPAAGLDAIDAFGTAHLPRYRWYFFKEAFSSAVAERAIEYAECEPGDLIIDPFAGSGTVPLVAAQKGLVGRAFEVNPFLAFVSRTKLLQCSPQSLERRYTEAVVAARRGADSALLTYSTFSHLGGAKKWLFNEDVLRSFEGAWQAMEGRQVPSRMLMRLCLISAAMDVCNASKDGKCLRYRSNWRQLAFDGNDFIEALATRVHSVKVDLERAPLNGVDAKISNIDSRSLSQRNLGSEKFRLCVTSPPYLNSFDYSDVYRPELFLGKFVRDNNELRAIRLNTVRSHLQVSWSKPAYADFGEHYVATVSELQDRIEGLWDSRIPQMIQAYFEDMRRIIARLKSMAAPEASMWIVVSTSAYAGIEIPVDYIIADIASQEGWAPREVRTIRYLRRVPVQQWHRLKKMEGKNRPLLRESIVVLDAKPKARSAL